MFVYKSLFIFVCIFLLFHFTIGVKIKQLSHELEKMQSKENIEVFKNKIRGELKNALEKDKYLDPEDAKLINDFINKLQEELSDQN
tara:strand:+ start:1174 stop:1431 length:258 start_codon:yes stop_codon:yes gene_type:complete